MFDDSLNLSDEDALTWAMWEYIAIYDHILRVPEDIRPLWGERSGQIRKILQLLADKKMPIKGLMTY